MSAIVERFSSGQDQLPVCLGGENSHRLVSLWNMLQRYAFGFYEIVCRLEHLYEDAKIRFSSSYPNKVYVSAREELSQCLAEMRKECGTLALDHTSGLISHAEAQVLRKGEGYTYNELLSDLDTLRFSFSAELRKRLFFRIEDGKEKY